MKIFNPLTAAQKIRALGIVICRDAMGASPARTTKNQSCYSLNLLNLVQTICSDNPNPENPKILLILIQTNFKSQKSFHPIINGSDKSSSGNGGSRSRIFGMEYGGLVVGNGLN
ncbi:hypothetical protein [Botryobacter ruber]|uniref:hypothetical protein n=1 Tax=Botryobacter ruber TaxID=2171629 RepID=UPI000F649FC5|nr:hypothetical protein [Botryobacter ruber]